MPELELIASINSLILTLVVLGFGYLSLLFGYLLADKHKEFFSEKLKATDKIMMSFIIGGFSFISILLFFEVNETNLIDSLWAILLYQIMLSIIFGIFIGYVLKSADKT